MKINEVILTEEQLDELNLKGLGQGVGKAIGGVAGGVVQGAKNVWSGMKQGYAGAQQALAPDQPAQQAAQQPAGQQPAQQTTGRTLPAQTGGSGEVASNNLLARAAQGTAQDPAQQQAPAQPQVWPKDPKTGANVKFNPDTGEKFASPADSQAYLDAKAKEAPAQAQQPAAQPAAQPAGQQAAADQQAKVGVGQINKIIPTLRTRDLQSVKKNVDATIAKKTKQPAAAPAAQQPAAPAQAPEDDNPNIQRGYNMQESKIVKFRSNFLGIEI